MQDFIEYLKNVHVLHTWTFWQTTDSGDVPLYAPPLMGDPETKKLVVGRYVHQERHCERCGKIQVRQTRT